MKSWLYIQKNKARNCQGIKIMSHRFIIALIIVFMFCTPALAAAPHKQIPIQVEADHMVSTQKDNSVLFTGRAVAKQGSMTIHSDELTVYYDSQKDDKKSKAKETKSIKRMFAKGNVKIVQKDWVASGDTAEYFDAERKVVLVGHTKVWQDNNMVTGDRFVMFLDEGKSIVEHDQKKGERVKAFFYPDKKK